MKFSCPLICGLMLSCICFRGSYEELAVIQSPSTITVREGESAQISCCWNKTTEANNALKVVWLKNGERIPREKQPYQTLQNCSVLNFTNIVKNDTGDYVCKVIRDIPYLVEKEGIKTALNVVHLERSTETTTQGKPDGFDHSKISPEDENDNHMDPRIKGSSASREAVMIYIFRSLPFICLLMAFFYLNRDNKQATKSKPVEHAVKSEEGPDEDLEAGETQRNETEVSEREKERDSTEKPATENEKNKEKETVVVVDLEQGSSPMRDNESETVSVLDNAEKTNLMADVEGTSVSVLDGIVSAL